MIRCITCLYPVAKPDLHFDEAGECSACRSSKNKKQIDWESRKKELEVLLDRFNGECIVPSSAGKDSTMQAIFLKNMGADVTAVTARTCHLTPIGRRNIDNLAKHVKTVEYVPNMSVRAKLNRLALGLVGDISHPEHMAIFTTPFRASLDLNIPLIMYGECPQMEYGGPHGSDEAKQLTERWRSEYGGFLGLRPSDFIGMEGITEKDMKDYTFIDNVGKTEAHFLGQYKPWNSHENAKIAVEHGFETMLPSSANWWNFENLDNAQTGIHDYMMFLKFGFGRACGQLSVDIRNGLISRKEAMDVLVHIDGMFPEWYAGIDFYEILDRIEMEEKRFDEILLEYTNDVSNPHYPSSVTQERVTH